MPKNEVFDDAILSYSNLNRFVTSIHSSELVNVCSSSKSYNPAVFATPCELSCVFRQSMACGFRILAIKYYSLSKIVNECDKRAAVKDNSDSVLHWKDKHRLCPSTSPFRSRSFRGRQRSMEMAFALNTDGLPSNGDQETINGDTPTGLGQTRLSRLVSAAGRQLLEKLNSARKNFPMKVFLLLLGFYTANALATILGQTGDWDVLVAGVVVAAIEGIGMLMYKKSTLTTTTTTNGSSSRRFESLIVMVNYWKAGVCLGLFVDAFKLGS
ncbi:hypothetical protein L1987_76243 [Smallanthus sonchifolius]|uniref:Uncharacterized protein n=1 Tax=Smallanthus sonchifolius TaxID=185202 RepID=A0ACB9A8B1_9ASTR|nr:hypothetical protein L1987_76243 [Smallanthus sonchifolius]